MLMQEGAVEQFALDTGPFAEDPYPIFDRLRKEAPLFWHEGLDAYMLTRYEDCRRLNEDGVNFFPSPDGKPPIPYVQQLAGDPHKRIRKMVNPAFTPRALANTVEPSLRGIAERLITPHLERGAIEIVSEYAEPMATRTISKLLNVAREDEKWMVKTADDLLEFEANPTNERLRDAYQKNLADLRAFFSGRLEEERQSPSGTLISDLVAAAQGGETLSNEELLANTMGIVVAGIETTKRLISNLTFLLVTHPEQMALVRADYSLLKPAIEETLRIHSPNQPIMRFVQNDVEFHGTLIKRGTRIYGMRGAANRDPEVWSEPNKFDISRFQQKGLPPHLAFGVGPHTCIGSFVAKRETTVAAETLLQKTKNLRLNPEHSVRFVNFRNRGPKALHLLFDPA